MRFALPLCLALAACSSDPCQDASCVFNQGDAAPTDLGAIDAVATVDDRIALPDFGTGDTGHAAAPDVVPMDRGELVDVAIDAGRDAGGDVASDQPGAVDAGSDAGADAPIVADTPDVPTDEGARPLCTTPRMPCRVHADCAACTPVPTLYWCCVPDDPSPTVCLPTARPCR